jgi:hypothetical protein
MRHQLFTAVALLLGCNASLAQVSTIGTTAMGIPTTPGVIVTSPLYGPGPFSATTLPGTPGTTLAPLPLASNPATPGTFVTCATPIPQIVSGTPAMPVTSMSATGGAIGMPSISAAPTLPSTLSTSMAGSTTSMTASTTAMSSSPLGTILTPIGVSSTGTVAPASPLGSPSTTVCSDVPGGPPTAGTALPLSTPEIPNTSPPGTIQTTVGEIADTSVNPTMTVLPTPNSAACSENVSMSLANPGMMAPANATGAAATPGVSPPSGC